MRQLERVIYYVVVTSTISLSSCLPAAPIMEGAKQLGSYGMREATSTEDKYLANYSDDHVCLSATTTARIWDASTPGAPFVREAKRREMAETCRDSIDARAAAAR